MIFNPWHDVSPGDSVPNVVRAIIEIPRNCRAKYELEKETGMIHLDRVISSSVNYPANYGFIPQTYCDDNDPLDILVLSQIDIVPMCSVDAKIIGVMRMIDQGEADDKIIAVAVNDKSVSHFNDLSELPEHTVDELRTFFEDYKKLENKEVSVEAFQGKDVAIDVLNKSFEDYNTKIRKS